MKLWVMVTLLLGTVTLSGQVGSNSHAGNDVTFRSTTQLVITSVTVSDRSGRPLPGLSIEDFAISEDGIPQKVHFCEFQDLTDSKPLPPMALGIRDRPVSVQSRGQFTSVDLGDARYRNRRLLAFYFDIDAMALPDRLRAVDAAKAFIRTKMTSNDLISIMAFASGSVQVVHEFTFNREALLQSIEILMIGENLSAPVESNYPGSADTRASFGQNDTEFHIFFTDRQLAALQTASNMLGKVDAHKALIYFTSGLRLEGRNNHAQLRATVNSAVRAGVSLWPVDARGLVAEAPLGDAGRSSPGGLSMYSDASFDYAVDNRQRLQDTLWTLAADTGGKALVDSNDLAGSIVQAQLAIHSYYVLGYYTSNERSDGRFRKVEITVRGGLRAKLSYRNGYYAAKRFGDFDGAEKERQLEEALMLEDPITDLPIAMETAVFQLNEAEYLVNLSLRIPGTELALARRRGRDRTHVEFIGEIRDAYGTTVANVRDRVDIKLGEDKVAEIARRPIEYETAFTLLPGRYRVKMLARDNVSGRIGTYEMPFSISNLNNEQEKVPISSVILSRQSIDPRDAVYTVLHKSGSVDQMVDPLIHSGVKILPSVTRVFSRAKEMVVYLLTYRTVTSLAYVSFFRHQIKVLETTPSISGDVLPVGFQARPIRIRVPLAQLEVGEYLCQVTIVDPTDGKVSFWVSPVMITP